MYTVGIFKISPLLSRAPERVARLHTGKSPRRHPYSRYQRSGEVMDLLYIFKTHTGKSATKQNYRRIRFGEQSASPIIWRTAQKHVSRAAQG